jgi:hypothetical protein
MKQYTYIVASSISDDDIKFRITVEVTNSYTRKKRCQTKPWRFRGTLKHTLRYRASTRNLLKVSWNFNTYCRISYEGTQPFESFVNLYVPYNNPIRFSWLKKVSYETFGRYRNQKVSY